MINTVLSALTRVTKSLPALLAALVIGGAALPALAQDNSAPSLQWRPPEQAAPVAAERSDLLLAHKVKLGLPPLIDDEALQAPKLSVELGYGRALPPLIGTASPSAVPEQFWGPAGQRAIKANLSMGF